MTVYRIESDADDGVVYQYGTSESTASTGGIDLTVRCWASGNFTFRWTPILGQLSVRIEVRNGVGDIVHLDCENIFSSTSGIAVSNRPLWNEYGPFTLEVIFYSSVLCNATGGGAQIGTGTATGWSLPNNPTSSSNTGRLRNNDVGWGDDYLGLGLPEPYNQSSWMRFIDVVIPQGAEILYANLRLLATARALPIGLPGGSYKPFTFRAEQTDDGTVPTSYVNYDTKSKTTAEVVVTPTSWSPGNFYSYSVIDIIQEIINRPGWTSGNAITIFWEDTDYTAYDDTWLEAEAFPSFYSPTLSLEYGIASIGTAAGTSSTIGAAIFGVKGTATGGSTVIAFGHYLQTAVGTAAGTSEVLAATSIGARAVGTAAGVADADNAEGVAGVDIEGVGTAAGVADADNAEALAGWDSIGSMAGIAEVLGVGEMGTLTVGSAAGIATALGVGLAESAAIGISVGVATVAGFGISNAESVGSSIGIAGALGVGISDATTIGTAAGVANADNAEGLQGWDSVGSSTGTGAASGAGLSLNEFVGSAAGISTASGSGAVLFKVVGSAAGGAIVYGAGGWLVWTTGSAAGTSKMQGRILSEQHIWLQDLSERRGVSSVGFDSPWFLELDGAIIVEPTAFEPDPTTYRNSHYYNAMTNTLYRKVITRNGPGVVVAHWQKVSD